MRDELRGVDDLTPGLCVVEVVCPQIDVGTHGAYMKDTLLVKMSHLILLVSAVSRREDPLQVEQSAATEPLGVEGEPDHPGVDVRRHLLPAHDPGGAGLRDAAPLLPIVVHGIGGGLGPRGGSGGGGQRLYVRDNLVTVKKSFI